MRFLLVIFLGLPTASAAHVGHVIEASGHNHWIALGAIGAAGLAALWNKHKEKADKDAEADEADDLEEEPA